MRELQVELLKLPVKIKKKHKGFGLLPGESVQFWQDPAHESTGVGALSICAFVGQSPILPACGAGIDGHW
jgi:hypothetical protein